jgi:hypothetical protein
LPWYYMCRYGILQDKRGFKVLEWLSTVVQTVVFLCMMWMSWSHLRILIIGEKSFWFRWLFANWLDRFFIVHKQSLKIIFCGINLQASPSDPENFPFVVLGNKIDVDGGNSRVVRWSFVFMTRVFFLMFEKIS